MIIQTLLALVGIAAAAPALEALPVRPDRPHGFDDLTGRDVDLAPVGQPAMRVHVRTVGTGPPLLLVHGMMTSAYSFRYVADALAEHFSVYVPDLPGAGRTVAPPDTDMRPQGLANVLAALIDTLGLDRPYVVANSLGGYLGVWLAVEHPEHVGRLLVMHAPGFPEPRLQLLRVATRLPGARRLYTRMVTRNPEEFVRRNVHYHDDSVKSREETAEYGRIFRDDTQTRLFFAVLRDTLDTRHMNELRRRLAATPLGVPVRLLWARHDVMVPPWTGPAWRDALGGAGLVWLDDTSHFMQVDRPDETVSQILAFRSDR